MKYGKDNIRNVIVIYKYIKSSMDKNLSKLVFDLK